MSADFNEHSTDAMFSRILQRMDTQDASLARIEAATEKTGTRVDTLERERWYQRGIVAAVSVGAVAIWEFITRK